ncbi:hypothetical protein [Microbispora sp. H11081]|uniref:hypothetical protein n=1 Tax=Microbispora sp. H11081 TaxID=2729107 RepID=UPI0014728374|nr:hypothetical protein [Microbispora sp. H11081]
MTVGVSRSVKLPDGRELPWEGFSTGPSVLTDERIDGLARDLLGLDPARVSAEAAARLRPYVAAPGTEPPPFVLMHSATRTTKGFEGDVAEIAAGRVAYDVPGYLEARVVSLARPQDFAVGRHAPWREAVGLAGIDHLDIGDVETYYLSQALLLAARDRPAVLDPLVAWYSARPGVVTRLYALDQEMQIFLLWLADRAGADVLRVDANDPVVSSRWNRKNHIHPAVADVADLDWAGLAPDDLLAAEQRRSEGFRRLEMAVPVLPGYLVPRGEDPAGFTARLVEAARALRERYGLTAGCLKPGEAGDGARIVTGLDLADEAALAAHAAEAFAHGDDYLLEAHVAFPRFSVSGRDFIAAPSGHVRYGQVAEGLTVQLMNGCSWEGNATLDKDSCRGLGVPEEFFVPMMDAIGAVREAFNGPAAAREGCQGGLAMGGLDFAIGTVGGRFGARPILGVIDFNLSSHGAEYMRAFQEGLGDADYVATRVYRPAAGAGLGATREAVEALAGGRRAGVVGCVPGRWGMVAVEGSDTLDAVDAALGLVRGLSGAGLAVPP